MKYNLLNFCEKDTYAIQSYCAIHNINSNLNLGDIKNVDIDKLPICDLITHGSPCTDFSIAGNQKGGNESDDTASSLIWYSVKIIAHCKPKFVIWENVKNVLGPRHINNFNKYLDTMSSLGYNNYYQILNAKDYGIPQNRERIYVVSIRKDIDYGFVFPKPFELQIRLKDILDATVEDKYYLNTTRFIPKNELGKQENLLELDNNKIRVRQATKRGYIEAYEGDAINLSYPNSKTRRGRVIKNGVSCTLETSPQIGVVTKNTNQLIQVGQIYGLGKEKNPQAGRIYDPNGISPTMDTCNSGNRMPKVIDNLQVRKLTPKECYKLMGFDDVDYEKASKYCSSTQLYKQAGNSIVVNVLECIYKSLQSTNPEFKEGLSIISLFSGIGAFEKALERM